ncbi:hypothetical protein Tco_0056339 [Tanacetum coccineum]
MAPKRTTRSTPVTPAPTATTTTITEAQLQALIDQGVAAAMAEAEASRVRNGYDSNSSRPRLAQAIRECTYSEFLKCKPLDFKGTEGVVRLTRWFEKMESYVLCKCYWGPEVTGALSKKSKRPKSKKPPTETKVTLPKPTEGSEQSHSVSSGTVPDPQDLERNIQLGSTRLPSTLEEGTRKSQPLPEGPATHPKDSRGNI